MWYPLTQLHLWFGHLPGVDYLSSNRYLPQWSRDLALGQLERRRMESTLKRIHGSQYGLIAFPSISFFVGSSLGQTQKMSLAETYLTSGVAYEEAGLQVNLFDKWMWSHQGEGSTTLNSPYSPTWRVNLVLLRPRDFTFLSFDSLASAPKICCRS